MARLIASLLLFLFSLPAFAATAPAPRDVDITAPDGVKLKATYYAAAKPGPAVLLLHMCNSNRKAWEPVASQLSAEGINALTLDYRGYGESEGERIDPQGPAEAAAGADHQVAGRCGRRLCLPAGPAGREQGAHRRRGRQLRRRLCGGCGAAALRSQVAGAAGGRREQRRPEVSAAQCLAAHLHRRGRRRRVRSQCSPEHAVAV